MQTIANGRVRLLFKPGMPDEIREVLVPLLDKCSWVIPQWLDELKVAYSPGPTPDVEPGVLAAMEIQPEYRDAVLWIFGIWMQEPKDARERTIVHELTHLLAAPMQQMTDKLIETLCKDNAVIRPWVEEQARQALEATVCDTAEALMRGRQTGSTRRMR